MWSGKWGEGPYIENTPDRPPPIYASCLSEKIPDFYGNSGVHKYDRQVFSPVAKLMTFNPAIYPYWKFLQKQRLALGCKLYRKNMKCAGRSDRISQMKNASGHDGERNSEYNTMCYGRSSSICSTDAFCLTTQPLVFILRYPFQMNIETR